MMATELFELAAELLEQRTSLDRLEARGTLRIALKSAGLEPASLTAQQLTVVFERILPGELETRGVDDAAATCSAIAKEVASSPLAGAQDGSRGVDEIFRRLGGD
jgi:hypothetical protein